MSNEVSNDVALMVDAKGLKCPLPVVRVKKAIQNVQVGQIIQVEATDPGSMADFQAWARSTGHELLLAEDGGNGVYNYQIRRTK